MRSRYKLKQLKANRERKRYESFEEEIDFIECASTYGPYAFAFGYLFCMFILYHLWGGFYEDFDKKITLQYYDDDLYDD